jgi:excisionase family DNA binding protein
MQQPITTIPQEESLLTMEDAMAYLRVSRSTLYRFIGRGTVTSRKVGNTYRFYRSDLTTAVKENKATLPMDNSRRLCSQGKSVQCSE